MLKDYPFEILRIAVDYVARANVLRALERPRASDISWDPRLLFAVTCMLIVPLLGLQYVRFVLWPDFGALTILNIPGTVPLTISLRFRVREFEDVRKTAFHELDTMLAQDIVPTIKKLHILRALERLPPSH